MAVLVKTLNGLAWASVKNRAGLAVASIKNINGLDTTAGGANILADLWEPFETVPSGGNWSSDGSAQFSASTSGEKTLTSTVNSVADTGTNGLLRTLTTSSVTNDLIYNIGSDQSTLNGGFWFMFHTDPNRNHYLLRLLNNGGSDVNGIRLTTSKTIGEDGGTTNGSALSADTWYWIAFQAVQSTSFKVSVYTDTGTLVGSEITVAGSSNASRKVYISNYNGDLDEFAVLLYWDDLILSWSGGNSTYPFGP